MPRETLRADERRALRSYGGRLLLAEHAVAPWAALDDMGVVQESIEQRARGRGVAEELGPLVDRAVRGEERARAFVAAHHELEQILGGGLRQLAQAEVVDDEQRYLLHPLEVVLAP